MSEFANSELVRRLAQTVVIGTVVELDGAGARVKVEYAPGARTDWLPLQQVGSASFRVWAPQTVGSQVMVVSPQGDLTKGVVLAGPYSGNAPDSASDSLRISGPGWDMRVSGDKAVITGSLEVSGDVVAQGVSLVNHTHGGVTPGGGNTAKPNS